MFIADKMPVSVFPSFHFAVNFYTKSQKKCLSWSFVFVYMGQTQMWLKCGFIVCVFYLFEIFEFHSVYKSTLTKTNDLLDLFSEIKKFKKKGKCKVLLDP